MEKHLDVSSYGVAVKEAHSPQENVGCFLRFRGGKTLLTTSCILHWLEGAEMYGDALNKVHIVHPHIKTKIIKIKEQCLDVLYEPEQSNIVSQKSAICAIYLNIMWNTEICIITPDKKDVKKIKQQNQNNFCLNIKIKHCIVT